MATRSAVAVNSSTHVKDLKTPDKIERLAHSAVKTVTAGKNPALEIRTRSLSNALFNEKKRIIELGDRTQSREFFNTAMARKFMQTFLIAECARR